MPASDLDISRSAHLFIQLHGDEATVKAREMVEQMQRKGDHKVGAPHPGHAILHNLYDDERRPKQCIF